MQDQTKKKFASLFSQIKADHANAIPALNRSRDSDILIVDGTNNFIRCWSVVPTLSENGEHVGGISGFLTSLGHTIKLLRPTRVIIVFDGKGGSERRRKLYPGYKANRKTVIRVNRAYEEMSDPKTEQEAMVKQMLTLVDFLKALPITLISVDHIEADDTIAYIATQMYPASRMTIMSADKDFLQLVNDRVSVWSPIKKKVYGVQDIINEYGVHPTNFVYYRIFEGDASDDIGGIKGIARKTAIKLFPMIVDSTETSLEKLLCRAKDCVNESKNYASVVEKADILARNYSLMQLKDPNFSPALQMQINDNVDRVHDYNKFLFVQKLTAHGMHGSIPNYHVWMQEVFQPLAQLASS